MRTLKGNRIPTAAPTPVFGINPKKSVYFVDLEKIEFKEIFSDTNIVVFEVKTETYFSAEKVTRELLQKFSESKITPITLFSKEMFGEFKNRIARAQNIFGLFSCIKKIQKSGNVEEYSLKGMRFENSSSYKNYFIAAIKK